MVHLPIPFPDACWSGESDFLSYIALGERNKDLMRKNLVLEQRVRALTELLDRAEHDSTYTEMRQRELLDGFRHGACRGGKQQCEQA